MGAETMPQAPKSRETQVRAILDKIKTGGVNGLSVEEAGVIKDTVAASFIENEEDDQKGEHLRTAVVDALFAWASVKEGGRMMETLMAAGRAANQIGIKDAFRDHVKKWTETSLDTLG